MNPARPLTQRAAKQPEHQPETLSSPASLSADMLPGAVSDASAKAPRERRSAPPLLLEHLRPGMRVAVAVSGGADSIALLRALALESARLGVVLSVAHMHHGIRGQDADRDAAFVAEVSGALGLGLHRRDVDTPAVARAAGVGLEEAARSLRYSWFAELLGSGTGSSIGSGIVDAVATAHTLNDQAETVLLKLLRGAWTEGLSGIYPVLKADEVTSEVTSEVSYEVTPDATQSAPPAAPSADERSASRKTAPPPTRGPAPAARGLSLPGLRLPGLIVRPLLAASRTEIAAWLESIGQSWREDASNADLAFTRNRIRHELLPGLATYNPRIVHQLARVAEIAREEDAYWQAEVARLLPGLLLPGRAVRGGGRTSSTLPGERALSIEVERLRALHPALVRRLLRGAAKELGVPLDFDQTARLVALLDQRPGGAPKREELTGELRAERTPRELRLVFSARSASAGSSSCGDESPQILRLSIPVPGEGEGFGVRVRLSLADGGATPDKAILRAAAPTDRVQLRYSRGAPKKIKEVLERMGIPAADRAGWPVLEWQGEIVWMRDVVLEPTTASGLLTIVATTA